MLGAFKKAMCQQKPQSTITDGDYQHNGNGVPITSDSCAIKEDGTHQPRQPTLSAERSRWAPTRDICPTEVGTHQEWAGPDPAREAREVRFLPLEDTRLVKISSPGGYGAQPTDSTQSPTGCAAPP